MTIVVVYGYGQGLGKGHLACVSYAGGKGYPRRNYLSKEHDRNIRDEITFRSYYKALDNPQVDGAKEAETVSVETQPLTS